MFAAPTATVCVEAVVLKRTVTLPLMDSAAAESGPSTVAFFTAPTNPPVRNRNPKSAFWMARMRLVPAVSCNPRLLPVT